MNVYKPLTAGEHHPRPHEKSYSARPAGLRRMPICHAEEQDVRSREVGSDRGAEVLRWGEGKLEVGTNRGIDSSQSLQSAIAI